MHDLYPSTYSGGMVGGQLVIAIAGWTFTLDVTWHMLMQSLWQTALDYWIGCQYVVYLIVSNESSHQLEKTGQSWDRQNFQ